GTRNKDKSSSGCECLRACRTYAKPDSTLTHDNAAVSRPALGIPLDCRPNTKHASAVPARMKPRRSNGFERLSLPPLIHSAAATSVTMPIGTFIRNTYRHDPCTMSRPPNGGPTTGAISAGMASDDNTLTYSDLSALRSTRMRPTVDIKAAPTPCAKRAMTKGVNEEDSPAASELSVNRTMPPRNI